MEEIKTIEQAITSMCRPGVTEQHRWEMLALMLQWMGQQLGCEFDKEME